VVAERPDTAPPIVEGYAAMLGRFLDPDTSTITLAGLRETGLASLVERHLGRDSLGVFAIAQVYPTAIPWRPGVVERFQRGLAVAPAGAMQGVTWLGDALGAATRPSAVRGDVLRACALAMALTVLVLGIRFRRAAPVLLALVPAACGLAVMLGVMALLGLPLNLITLAAVPVVVGIGSDDGIHIVDRLERGEDVMTVVRETGIPMGITTVTTIGGFLALLLARFPDVAAAGGMAALGLVVALAASLHLLPLLVREYPSWGGRDPAASPPETTPMDVT
jgi:predicted exporter